MIIESNFRRLCNNFLFLFSFNILEYLLKVYSFVYWKQILSWRETKNIAESLAKIFIAIKFLSSEISDMNYKQTQHFREKFCRRTALLHRFSFPKLTSISLGIFYTSFSYGNKTLFANVPERKKVVTVPVSC